MHPYSIPFMVVGCAMMFVVTVAALRGPLRPYVPDCTSTSFGFCMKRYHADQ